MSKKFYAVNRATGERWKPSTSFGRKHGERGFYHFLVMYDSGLLAEVEMDSTYQRITSLDTSVWKL